eukprot:jgi/Chlat1/6526/Chrsp45S06070
MGDYYQPGHGRGQGFPLGPANGGSDQQAGSRSLARENGDYRNHDNGPSTSRRSFSRNSSEDNHVQRRIQLPFYAGNGHRDADNETPRQYGWVPPALAEHNHWKHNHWNGLTPPRGLPSNGPADPAMMPMVLDIEPPSYTAWLEERDRFWSDAGTASVASSFLARLHSEIEEFCMQVTAECERRRPYQQLAVNRVTKALAGLWPRANTKIFGSYATGLMLPSSDVDVVVCLPRGSDPSKEAGYLEGRNGRHIRETYLQHAARHLRDMDWVQSDSLKTIDKTAVPIIQLVAKLPRVPEPSEAALPTTTALESNGVYSDSERLETPEPATSVQDDDVRVPLDISFEGPTHSGMRTVNLVRDFLKQFPSLRPLTLVLKQFLTERNLRYAYTGGLSSFCLHQHSHSGRVPQTQNLGRLLMDFLHFYGYVFDPRSTCVVVRGGGMFVERAREHRIDPLMIEDPLCYSNNIGRNCFRMLQCTKAFADAHAQLEAEFQEAKKHSRRTTTEHGLLQLLLASFTTSA